MTHRYCSPRAIPLLGMLFVAQAAPVGASLIAVPSSAFSPTATVADFTVVTSQSLPYEENGATFVSYPGFAQVLSFNNILALAGTGTLRVTFEVPVTRAGFLMGIALNTATVNVTAFADLPGTTSVGSVGLGTFATSGFAGFQADTPFRRADILFSVPSSFASFFIDDFRFEGAAPAVPEPATLALLLLGGAGVSARMLRRRG